MFDEIKKNNISTLYKFNELLKFHTNSSIYFVFKKFIDLGLGWFVMVLFGFVWYGLVWFCLVLFGLVWLGLVWFVMVCYGLLWFGKVW